ncbi:MAG: hypothetical protein ACRBN8_19025 [Nannocystales bacterium]
MEPARLPFERLSGGEQFAFYAWGPILISLNGVQASDAYFESFDRALDLHLAGQHSDVWMYSLHRIERVTSQPTANARQRSTELLKRVDPFLRANVMVFDMRGMAGAIIRTFVSGVFLLTRTRVPNNVCDDPVEGAQWLRDVDPPPPGLAENFDAFRDTVLEEADRVLGPSPRR